MRFNSEKYHKYLMTSSRPIMTFIIGIFLADSITSLCPIILLFGKITGVMMHHDLTISHIMKTNLREVQTCLGEKIEFAPPGGYLNRSKDEESPT
jgi:hypothetical protein